MGSERRQREQHQDAGNRAKRRRREGRIDLVARSRAEGDAVEAEAFVHKEGDRGREHQRHHDVRALDDGRERDVGEAQREQARADQDGQVRERQEQLLQRAIGRGERSRLHPWERRSEPKLDAAPLRCIHPLLG